MKKHIKLLATGILFVLGTAAQAQSGYVTRSLFNFAWDINVPLNNKDFISETSTYGFKLEGRYFIQHNISIGAELNWSSLYEYKPRETYQIENGAITTDLYNYMYNLPFNANAHYYFMPDKMVNPYAGLGLGAMYSEQDVYFNIYNLYSTNWGFLVRPEVGALIKFGPDSFTAGLIGVRYNYATNQESSFDIRNIQTLSFQFGIAFLN